MHVFCINYIFDASLTTPAEVLERYVTLVEWSNALAAAGARVSVVQKFSADAEVIRNGVVYRFVRNHLNHSVINLRPDIVHVNGLQFARRASQLKRFLRMVPIL